MTFPVYNSDGAQVSLTYEDFEFRLKKFAGDRNTALTLTVGGGITLTGNEIIIRITTTQSNISEGEYYWELLQIDDNETWLNGKAIFHNGVFDAFNDDVSLEL